MGVFFKIKIIVEAHAVVENNAERFFIHCIMFPPAAVTNYRQLAGLNIGNLFSHCFAVQKSEIKVSQDGALSGGENLHLASRTFCSCCRHFWACGRIASVSAFIFKSPSPLYVLPPSASLIRTLVTFRAVPDNPRLSLHLKVLQSVTPAWT